MKRIQYKDYQIGTYQINKIFLSGFDDKYIQNNGYDRLALGWLSELIIKKIYLNNYLKKLLCQA